MQETQVPSLVWEDPLEKRMANHSSISVWRFPWTDEPGKWVLGVTRRHKTEWLTLYNVVMVFTIHQHEFATGIHVSPLCWTHLPPHPILPGFTEHWLWAPWIIYIKLPLAICFTYGDVYVSMLSSQIIPPSPFPTESKSLFFVSVCPLLTCKGHQDHQYHLSRFHIYALIYDICLSLSDLLHFV